MRACHGPYRGVLIRATKRQAALVALFSLLAASLFTAAARPTPVTSKQAQAQQVLAQIESIDASLEHVVEAYNASQIKLDGIKAEQQVNERRLEIARANYKRAQVFLQERLVALYTSHDESALEVLLGSSSLDDLLDRMDTVSRVSEQDTRIVGEVKSFRAEIKKREGQLERARADQERVLAEQAAKKSTIERQLAERQQLLSSIKSEIERLKQQEAAQQVQLESQARSRLGDGASAGGGVVTFHFAQAAPHITVRHQQGAARGVGQLKRRGPPLGDAGDWRRQVHGRRPAPCRPAPSSPAEH